MERNISIAREIIIFRRFPVSGRIKQKGGEGEIDSLAKFSKNGFSRLAR